MVENLKMSHLKLFVKNMELSMSVQRVGRVEWRYYKFLSMVLHT